MRLRDESGQTAVEFALTLPILLHDPDGCHELRPALLQLLDLTSAARDGARKASISRNNATATTTVKSTISPSTTVVDDSKTTVTLTPAAPWAGGTDVTVKVSYPYSLSIFGISLGAVR